MQGGARPKTRLSLQPVVLAGWRGRQAADSAEWLARAEARLKRFAAAAGIDSGHELSLTLCDGPSIRRVNARWRGVDSATDVLSFPLNELRVGQLPPPGPVGDIMLCLPYLKRAARELGVDARDHMDLLLVHGLLHLLGHDHVTDRQHARMRKAELALLEMGA